MPFGEEVNPPNPPTDKRLFTGQEHDFETGLDYFNARYLANGYGRFTIVDPLGEVPQALADPQGYNPCAHGSNNPLRFVDPTGLQNQEPTFKVEVVGILPAGTYVFTGWEIATVRNGTMTGGWTLAEGAEIVPCDAPIFRLFTVLSTSKASRSDSRNPMKSGRLSDLTPESPAQFGQPPARAPRLGGGACSAAAHARRAVPLTPVLPASARDALCSRSPGVVVTLC